MIQPGFVRLTATASVALATFLTVIGCSDGTPSVSSSTEEATAKGTVTYKGKKVAKGTITFDPANVNRKMAAAVSAPIDENGSYTLKTMVGENQVSFSLPEYAADQALGYVRIPRDVASGESSIDFDLPPKP